MSAGHSGRTTYLQLPYMENADVASGLSFWQEAQGVENQLVILMRLWGAGVLGSSSWAVTAGTGLQVSVAAGEGIVDQFAGRSEVATTVTVPDDATSYIWAIPHYGTETDQAWVLEPEFVRAASSTGTAGTLLARVVSAAGALTITDLRLVIGRQALQDALDATEADIAELVAALGSDYAGYTGPTPAPVADRLDALEAGAGGEGGATYWGTLEKSASIDTTIDEAIAAAIEDAQAAQARGLTISDADAVTSGLLIELIREVGLSGQSAVANQPAVYVFHPSTSPVSLYDAAHSTAHPDRDEGTIH